MKKLFLIPVFVLGFVMSANAQDVKTTTKRETAKTTVTQEKKDFKKIDPVTVNNDALKTILKNYKGHSIQEAWRATDGEYKLVLTKDKKNKTVYIDKSGKIIKEA
ncbi:MAG TPA: hypothetical protein VK528_03680 [Flavobacterium sp.]|nr:hypothetical protein [Flavobacterium sp.]